MKESGCTPISHIHKSLIPLWGDQKSLMKRPNTSEGSVPCRQDWKACFVYVRGLKFSRWVQGKIQEFRNGYVRLRSVLLRRVILKLVQYVNCFMTIYCAWVCISNVKDAAPWVAKLNLWLCHARFTDSYWNSIMPYCTEQLLHKSRETTFAKQKDSQYLLLMENYSSFSFQSSGKWLHNNVFSLDFISLLYKTQKKDLIKVSG